MVSRCKIISRSSNELYSCHNMPYDLQDEDVWFNQDKLYQDHIVEILQKWDAIDDEIWAKLIVMERNRRVAKAYVRAPAISINGSDVGFDGYTIGINGFESSTSDAKVLQVKKMIGKGVKVKMDQMGNILIRRMTRSNVFIRTNNSTMNSSSSKSTSQLATSINVPEERAVKLFDMKSFAHNIDQELMNSYPDRRKLESQCITLISFIQDSPSSILDLPCYLLLINVVAIEMLKSRLPPTLPSSIHQSSLSSNSSSGSSSQQQQQQLNQRNNRKGMKFTSFDPKVTYSSSSGDSSTNPYIETNNNNNNYNHNQSRKSSHSSGSKQLAPVSAGRRHNRDDSVPLPTPDYDEEVIEQVYGRTRYQKNTSSSSSTKPISRSTGKMISPIKSKTNHPLKESTNRNMNAQVHSRLNPQPSYGRNNYKLSKSQSTSHLNSYQSKSSSNGFSLSDSSDPYTSIKTSLDDEEIYPVTTFRGGFGTSTLFDYHPFALSSGRMTESSFTDDDINGPYGGNPKSRSNPAGINTRISAEKPYTFKYARNWK